jgi:hypothetical protein
MTETQNSLVIFDRTYTPAELFVPGATDPLLDRIRAEVAKHILDPSTPAGRAEIKALAFKVTKTKTAIDGERLKLVGDEKKRLAAIDVEGKRIRDTLDDLAAKVRQPVTDWENRDKARVDAHQAGVDRIKELLDFPCQAVTGEIAERLSCAQALDVSGFEEFITLATATKAQVVVNLTARLDASQKADADRAELERLRVEMAERDQRERDEKIASQAKAEAEAEAQRKAEAEARRVEDEKRQAEADAQAQQDRIKKDAEQSAADAAEELARVKQDSEAAVERALQEAAKSKRDEDAATAKREADKEHRATVNNAALAALVSAGLSEASAKTAIEAIAKGNVPGVKISY